MRLDRLAKINMADPDLVEQSLKIIHSGDECGIPLRLLGGLAVSLSSPSSTAHKRLKRSYADIDMVGLSRDKWRIKKLFNDLRYLPDERFNALHGRTRLIFYPPDGERHIDIFLDRFQMCHSVDLRQRLFPGYLTLSMADLLLTKLQVVQMNTKDMQDILAIIMDHSVGAAESLEMIDIRYLGKLTSTHWGLYTTLSDNLHRSMEETENFLNGEDQLTVKTRIKVMIKTLEESPKSVTWQMRSKIGRRIEWYELPDEVNR